MQRTIILLAALLLGAPALWALDKPKDKGKPGRPATPAEQYQAVVKEYQAAMQEFRKAYQEAKTKEQRDKAIEDKYPKPGKYSARLLELAEKHPKDAIAVDALIWVARFDNGAAGNKAIGLLTKNHALDKKVEGLLTNLQYSYALASEKLLQTILQKSMNHDLRAKACFSLAQFWKNQADMSHQLKTADKKDVQQMEAFLGKELVQQLMARDPDKLSKQAEKYYEQTAKEFASVKLYPFSRQTLGEMAKGALFELRFLAIGKKALDIEGEDIDGKKFKLSDYRGKVVLLDFWGNW